MHFRFDADIARYDQQAIQHLMEGFPSPQVEQILRVRHLQGRREKVAVCCLLADLLKELGLYAAPPVIGHLESGQPFLVDHPQLHLSISHCKNVVAVAIDDRNPIGIDVESRRKISPALLSRVCSAEEQQLIALSPDPDLEFIRLWTRKEAYVKQQGTGIKDSLPYTELMASRQSLCITSHQLSANTWLSLCYVP